MLNWYKYSAVCYAFLSDVEGCDFPTPDTKPRCRWFTRGWTLQKLLAPRLVLFFNRDWIYLGSRDRFASDISAITSIPVEYLAGGKRGPDIRIKLDAASVSMRMSWAASRTTTRVEDHAYCLLGLFDICMPMLYGEGAKAFYRLQEEVIKKTDDPTILAWGFKTPLLELEDYVDYWRLNIRRPLATGPWEFVTSGDLVVKRIKGFPRTAFSLSQRGLKLETPVIRDPIDPRVTYAVLGCGLPSSTDNASRKSEDSGLFILLPLVRAAIVDPSSSDEDQEYIRWTDPGGGPLLIPGDKLCVMDLDWAAVYVRPLRRAVTDRAGAAVILTSPGLQSSESARVRLIYPTRPQRPVLYGRSLEYPRSLEERWFERCRRHLGMLGCQGAPRSHLPPTMSPWVVSYPPRYGLSEMSMLDAEILALVIENPDTAPVLFICSFKVTVDHWQSSDQRAVELLGHAEPLNKYDVESRSQSLFLSILRDPQAVRRQLRVFDSVLPTEETIRETFKLTDEVDIVLDFFRL